jgi:hypothetical protein
VRRTASYAAAALVIAATLVVAYMVAPLLAYITH